MLEVIGSIRLNLAFDDLGQQVNEMLSLIRKYRSEGKFKPNVGIEQFAGEPQLERYRLAKRQWIDTLRKEVGAEAVMKKSFKNKI
jgi:menaquinone-dependent protoporphyrinogen IX oxidase